MTQESKQQMDDTEAAIISSNKILGDDRFRVANTQAHFHTGSDALRIPFANLANATEYRAIMRKTLTPTQIKALFTTPIKLLPTPVNSRYVTVPKIMYIVEGIAAFIDYKATAYAGANALEFRYTDASGTKVTADIGSAWLNSTANAYQYVAGITTAFAPVANAPIVVTIPTANPTLGVSPVTFVVYYKTVAFR